MAFASKHQAIFQALREQLAGGKFGEAGRMPSETAIARRFGVSRPTAARALRDLQLQGLVVRRVGSGTYARLPQNTGLASRLNIGLLATGLGGTEILEPVCHGIVRAGLDCHMTVHGFDADMTDPTREQVDAACQRLIDQDVAGVFFAPLERMPQREAVNRGIVAKFADAGVAVVLLDRDVLEFPQRSEVDLVSIDHFQAAFALTDHLLDLGRRRFRFIARPDYPPTTDLRMAGCREAMARRGLTLKRDWACFGDPADESFASRALRPMPDAIICSNDRTAALLIQSMTSLGTPLPTTTSIVGFDDVQYATLLSVPLTTIRQPCAELARIAVETMRSRIEAPHAPARQVLIKGELIIRKSSGTAQG
ncbi:MAG: GntR family transcriptional regulator [Phycisphaeraceae bacterium]|nr:GntR family transcriptional regulator [Phycisphaeraceae bacterium]